MPARFRTVGFRELAAKLWTLSGLPAKLQTRVSFAAGVRSAEKNAGIARRQIELGRNPWFLTPTEKTAVKRQLAEAFRSLRRGHIAAAVIAMTDAGWMMVARFQRHIELRKDEAGRMRPISEETVKRKRKAGQPTIPLKASGELESAYAVEVRRA